jgi:hypothetical protein
VPVHLPSQIVEEELLAALTTRLDMSPCFASILT